MSKFRNYLLILVAISIAIWALSFVIPFSIQKWSPTVGHIDPECPLPKSREKNLTYTNEKYGFQLTFPAAWDGYWVQEAKDNFYDQEAEGHLSTSTFDTIQFCVITNEPGFGGSETGFYPMEITIIPSTDWVKLTQISDRAKSNGEIGILAGTKFIADKNGLSFVYSGRQDKPADEQNPDFDLNKIAKTFRFTR